MKRLKLIQKLMGLGMILVSGLIIWITSTGLTVEEKDATAVLFTLPLGLYMLFTKKIIIDL